jgi:hypothetical protein
LFSASLQNSYYEYIHTYYIPWIHKLTDDNRMWNKS